MAHRLGQFHIGPLPLVEGVETPEWSAFEAVLGRMARREMTGGDAQGALWGLLDNATFETQWVIAGILNKDMRVGIGAKTINKAIPGLVPDFSCMLAEKNAELIRYPARAELKYNGDRNFAIIENLAVTFLSRTGKVIPGHNSLRREILSIFADGWVLDGEHMKGVWGEEDRDAPMVVYDILPLAAFRSGGAYAVPFRERRAQLEKMLPGTYEYLELSQGVDAAGPEDVAEYFQRVCDAGGEGLVIKPLDGFYEFKRSPNWVKMKPFKTVDVPVLGYAESEKVPDTLGALLVEFEGRRFKLGAGFSKEQRASLWNEPHLTGRLVEMKYAGLTPYGIPLCAAFIKFRDDLGE
jgi:DNA ligase-1